MYLLAEPADMRANVRAECRDCRRVNVNAVGSESVQPAGHHARVVEDQAVGEQMVVFDDLALLAAVVFGDDPTTAERQPLDEVIEGLTLVGRRLDRRAQLRVPQVLKQEACPDRHAQLTKRQVQAILTAVGSQTPQDGVGGEFRWSPGVRIWRR